MYKDNPMLNSILSLACDLVKTPSRAYEDSATPVLDVVGKWADIKGLKFNTLEEDGQTVGGYFHFASGNTGPKICLNACIDTCPFGAEELWSLPPASGVIREGTLYGRGSADSKIAASIFCHIFSELSAGALKNGELFVLLDSDEHTGNFGGVKAFVNQYPDVETVFIGYPGNDEIMLGARGFLRGFLSVYGTASHSGGRKPATDNALVSAARLIEMISSEPLPQEQDSYFDFGPKITLTAIHGGKGFSQIPDKVDLNFDIRLTPSFTADNAQSWLENVARRFEAMRSGSRELSITFQESWPCYRVPDNHPAVVALADNAKNEFGRPIPSRVCGPSNIGNFLASKGIPALCGFGVSYKNAHAADEAVEIDTVMPVFETYRKTILSMYS